MDFQLLNMMNMTRLERQYSEKEILLCVNQQRGFHIASPQWSRQTIEWVESKSNRNRIHSHHLKNTLKNSIYTELIPIEIVKLLKYELFENVFIYFCIST